MYIVQDLKNMSTFYGMVKYFLTTISALCVKIAISDFEETLSKSFSKMSKSL